MFILPYKAAPVFTPQNKEQIEVVVPELGSSLMMHPDVCWLLLHRV